MKKNITIIVLVLIILTAGAYLIGKNSNKNIAEPLPPADANLPTNPTPPAGNQVSDCTPTTAPWIKVLSPNGGETFTVGNQMEVKWTSCNVPFSDNVFIALHQENGTDKDVSFLSESTINDGSEVFTISNKLKGAYNLRIGSASAKIKQDYSDSSFVINPSVSSTVLPKYVGSHANCGGLASCWPPVVQNSSVAYSCNPHISEFEVRDAVEEKMINGKKYCIKSFGDSYAGGTGWTYTYTTANGSGTKTTTFGITLQSCGVYGLQTDPKVIECKNSQNNFTNNLDSLIASLM